MDKTLIIISTNTVPLYLKKTKYDVLAISAGSIVALNNSLINFKTLDDIIKRKEFSNLVQEFKFDFEKWIVDCDDYIKKKEGEKVCLPNGFWLMHRMLNYLYIVLITKKIKQKYNKFHFICYDFPENWIPIKKGYSNLTFSPGEKGVSGLISLLYLLLKNTKVEIIKRNHNYLNYFLSYIISIFLRSKNIFTRIIVDWFSKNFLSFLKKYSNIGVLQEGYDVSVILKRNNKKKYINLKAIILKKMYNKVYQNKTLNLNVTKISKSFFIKWFDNIGHNLLEDYSEQITFLSLINSDIKALAKMNIQKYNIKTILCSIGIQDQVEYICAKQCIGLSVKIHSFKHAGIESLFFEPGLLEPYLERNNFPPRTQYLHSNLEKAYYKNHIDVNTIVLGRLDLPIQKKKSSFNNKILYSLGPDNYNSYKEIDRLTSDKERYSLIKETISISLFYDNILDIKIHPSQKNNQFEWLKLMKKQSLENNFNILIEGTIDRIFYKYDLIIIDLLHTRVFTSLLYINIPIIIYVPEGIKLNNVNFLELSKRAFIIRKPSQINNIIKRMNENKLKIKSSKKFNKIFLNHPNDNLLFKDVLKKMECK